MVSVNRRKLRRHWGGPVVGNIRGDLNSRGQCVVILGISNVSVTVIVTISNSQTHCSIKLSAYLWLLSFLNSGKE
jgi:hypothetical protein